MVHGGLVGSLVSSCKCHRPSARRLHGLARFTRAEPHLLPQGPPASPSARRSLWLGSQPCLLPHLSPDLSQHQAETLFSAPRTKAQDDGGLGDDASRTLPGKELKPKDHGQKE